MKVIANRPLHIKGKTYAVGAEIEMSDADAKVNTANGYVSPVKVVDDGEYQTRDMRATRKGGKK